MFLDKNSKEAFIKKLQVCMKNYDYKDETKDVKGKVSIYLSQQTTKGRGVSAIFVRILIVFNRLRDLTPFKNSSRSSRTRRMLPT